MTIEEKAHAYDVALARAKGMYESRDDAELAAYIFPELAESEDEIHRKWILEYLYDGLRKSDEQFKGHFKSAIDWLEKQKPSWSEEDEKMKERLITRLNWITYNTRTDGTSPNITFFDEIEWLKSLHPQPKIEWSEEDEKMLKNVLWVLESFVSNTGSKSSPSLIASYHTYYKEIDWLKSLRPSWKPSEEQMKALQNAVALTACDKELVRLYNQLEKL